MSRKARILLLMVFVVLAMTCPVGAMLESAPDIQEVTLDAARIARISITAESREQLGCGYIYTATVTENLKGPSSKFDFFSTVRVPFSPSVGTYLIFVYEINISQVRAITWNLMSNILTDSQLEKIGCLTLHKYYLPSAFVSLIPISSESNKPADEAWIKFPTWRGPPARPFIRPCNNYKNADNTNEQHSTERGTKIVAVKWAFIRKQILDFQATPSGQC